MSLVQKIKRLFIVESKTLEIVQSKADFISYLNNQSQTLHNQNVILNWDYKKPESDFVLEIIDSPNQKRTPGFF